MGTHANFFHKEDFKLKTALHNDAMVIEAIIAGWKIGKVLVDNGSSADIIFANTFREMKIDQHLLEPTDVLLLGFGGRPVKALGKIALPVSFGNLHNARTERITFDMVEMYYPYFAILGWGFINKFDATIREIIENSLDIKLDVKPKKQKLRKMSDEKAQAVKAEVERLLEANVIRPNIYPE
ncbi:uncharacterized protein LOC105913982 [Setaria italica]|uniref:uncharacterized protein LOC105913982 n=1 Tax=Setaria italica TaxID=4555 RepID=UPI0006478C58|nr:uncharacterized protein LOC105913982 [Setaria italica]XP_034586640.1 uncharacterized protein LOC117849167 [Setaria viridis]